MEGSLKGFTLGQRPTWKTRVSIQTIKGSFFFPVYLVPYRATTKTVRRKLILKGNPCNTAHTILFYNPFPTFDFSWFSVVDFKQLKSNWNSMSKKPLYNHYKTLHFTLKTNLSETLEIRFLTVVVLPGNLTCLTSFYSKDPLSFLFAIILSFSTQNDILPSHNVIDKKCVSHRIVNITSLFTCSDTVFVVLYTCIKIKSAMYLWWTRHDFLEILFTDLKTFLSTAKQSHSSPFTCSDTVFVVLYTCIKIKSAMYLWWTRHDFLEILFTDLKTFLSTAKHHVAGR